MEIYRFPSGPFETNAYLLASGGLALIVDPAPGSADAIRQAAQGLKVEKILLTHSHWDHIGDCAELKREFGVPVLVHPEDAPNLREPGSDGLPLMVAFEGVEPDGFLENGQEISLGDERLMVVHVPGHARGQCAFYCAAHGFVVSGDLIFRGAMGRIDLPTAEPKKMAHSLAKVANLPGNTVIYPGHGEPTTVADEGWLPTNDLEV